MVDAILGCMAAIMLVCTMVAVLMLFDFGDDE
jgi:hypothetical protein